MGQPWWLGAALMTQTGPRAWRAFDNIAGFWGEERQNCAVVYRIVRQDHGLTVELVKKAADMGDYRMTASIVSIFLPSPPLLKAVELARK